MWLDSDPLEEEASTRLWIAVANPHLTRPRSITRIDLHTPGFRHLGPCWVGQSPACPRPEVLTAESPPWQVAPGGTLIFSAGIARATRGSGAFSFSGSYEWTDQASVHHAAIQPVRVQVLGSRPFGIAPEWLNFLKDLILPLTLVAVAWLLQRLQQTRSERQVVWTSMLSKVHQNAEKYYLPASMAMETLRTRVTQLRPWTGRTPDEFDRAMLPFLLVLKRMRVLVRRIGGFYFKDRYGERAVARSWEVFYRGTRAALDTRAVDYLVDTIGPFESEAQFAVRMSGADFRQAYVTVRTGLMAWSATTLELSLYALELCALLFDTETNRAFEMWYGEKELIPYEEIRRLRGRMSRTDPQQLAAEPRQAYERLNVVLDQYLLRYPET
jgi:hypothetical protein